MGGVVSRAHGERKSESLFVSVIGAGPLDRLDLVRSGELVDGLALEGRLEATLHRDIADLAPGEYVYVRAVQADGGAAWSSPISSVRLSCTTLSRKLPGVFFRV